MSGIGQQHFQLVYVPSAPEASLAEEVERGLSAPPKSLPCRFLYDRAGSRLFEEICSLPEYYPTRAERSILEKRADSLADLFPNSVTLVELGSGSAVKTQLLIDALLVSRESLRFVPIDISRSALEQSADALLADHPRLHIQAVCGEYEIGLQRLAETPGEPRLILWLGSSVGNLHRTDAATFLGRLRATMSPADRLLLGIDLRKDSAVLERAYDDSAGITAAFSLNLLARINRELDANFVLDRFRHRARYLVDEGCVEIHLESLCDQRVRIGALDRTIEFTEGETIHTENSYKYGLGEIDELAAKAGLRGHARWFDVDGLFCLELLGPA